MIAVGDPVGAALNSAVRSVAVRVDEDNQHVWGDLLRVANALRWRRLTQPQPNRFNPALDDLVKAVRHQVKKLKGTVNDEDGLEKIDAAAVAVGQADSPLGEEIVRLAEEVGYSACVVVAKNDFARSGMKSWLDDFGIEVLLPGDLQSSGGGVEQSYIIGPPTFFPAALITAPATEGLAFLMPAWFGNRSLPIAAFREHAEGGIEIRSKVHLVGDLDSPTPAGSEEIDVRDEYYPQPIWGHRESEEREPASGEVEARKILLAGGLGLWLDDGEYIRALDPRLPEGHRVNYEAVGNVRPGTYLVLREGETEHGAMFEAALAELGDRGYAVLETQAQWKYALAERLDRKGTRQVIDELNLRQVKAASRVRAWTDPTLISPRREQDLALLLEWLDIPLIPSFANAVALRQAVYRASADLRRELENSVGKADLRALEAEGFMRLELEREGFRGMIVARVLARAPFTEIISRPLARVPFEDKAAQWLE